MNSRWHPKTDREKKIEWERKKKVIRFMLGLALIVIVIKYLMTGCIVICDPWNGDELYMDPVSSEDVEKLV